MVFGFVCMNRQKIDIKVLYQSQLKMGFIIVIQCVKRARKTNQESRIKSNKIPM